MSFPAVLLNDADCTTVPNLIHNINRRHLPSYTGNDNVAWLQVSNTRLYCRQGSTIDIDGVALTIEQWALSGTLLWAVAAYFIRRSSLKPIFVTSALHSAISRSAFRFCPNRFLPLTWFSALRSVFHSTNILCGQQGGRRYRPQPISATTISAKKISATDNIGRSQWPYRPHIGHTGHTQSTRDAQTRLHDQRVYIACL